MTAKKGGGGSGSGRPPPPARQTPAAPPQPKRPQLRPIGAAKAPVIRPAPGRSPMAPHAPSAPRAATTRAPAAAAPPSRSAPLDSSPDDDATSVMERPVFDSERSLPKAKPGASAEAPRMRPAAGRPPSDTRATRPDIDLVPSSQRSPSERTVVMPNAPARPPHATAKSSAAGPRFPPPGASPSSRGGATSTGAHRALPRDAMPTVPPLEALVPKMASDRPRALSDPPRTSRSQPPGNAPADVDVRAVIATVQPVDVPPPATMPFVQDQTAAMYRGNWTPSAPPIAFGPVAHGHPSAPPPPNVRTHPPPAAPTANIAAPLAMPGPAAVPALSAQPPGVLGLVLFAAPLAFATMAVAALALL